MRLQRELTRHARHAADLFGQVASAEREDSQPLSRVTTPRLEQLRELEEELAALEALTAL